MLTVSGEPMTMRFLRAPHVGCEGVRVRRFLTGRWQQEPPEDPAMPHPPLFQKTGTAALRALTLMCSAMLLLTWWRPSVASSLASCLLSQRCGTSANVSLFPSPSIQQRITISMSSFRGVPLPGAPGKGHSRVAELESSFALQVQAGASQGLRPQCYGFIFQGGGHTDSRGRLSTGEDPNCEVILQGGILSSRPTYTLFADEMCSASHYGLQAYCKVAVLQEDPGSKGVHRILGDGHARSFPGGVGEL
eukprot:gene2748-biopygen1026